MFKYRSLLDDNFQVTSTKEVSAESNIVLPHLRKRGKGLFSFFIGVYDDQTHACPLKIVK